MDDLSHTQSHIHRHAHAQCALADLVFLSCVNLCFMFVEMLYGVWTNSLGLISDACRMHPFYAHTHTVLRAHIYTYTTHTFRS